MTMNSSGPISLAGTTAGQSIEIENGGNGTTQISLNDSAVRTLAGVASGAITMPTNFYGKSNRVTLSYTFASNTANASLNVTSISGYIAGKSDITITVNSGIYLYSTSTGNAGLTLTGGSTGDTVTLVNNGYIMGQGGRGGNYNPTSSPTVGGTALSLGFNTTVNNTNASAYIGGGGGGGGVSTNGGTPGGGGAGGGNGGSLSGIGGGVGGNIGSSGTDGTNQGGGCCPVFGTGGGGGRIFPGTGGAGGLATRYSNQGKGGGAGGGGGGTDFGSSSTGGAGGSSNSAGSAGNSAGGGGGGGWGASGGNAFGTGGAAGGKAVALNGNTVTWTSGNTTRVYGSVA